ncbi:transmembrane protein, putative [Bodo saltans]|uniref:Transmembrane protein, putative n=1 Tax=Bodo saltans TaxID=75058 RepID=A0A0S4IK21_BODSA|nr:transmembrane protein, putative [Bodo saltans]|eukprot:CUE99261.1 transmembrane protein, putative [Bodo saltans]
MVMLRSVEYNVTYGLVYGGADGDSTPLSDMHIYHYDKETWLAVTPPPDFNQLPPTLMLPAMVATGGENFTVFFGASSTLGLSRSVYEGVLDLKSMSVVSFRLINANATNPEDGLPGGRVGPCCVHYSGHPLTMCFGGVDGIDMLGDTWLYNHTNGTSTLIQPPSDAALYPSPRFAAQCDYLPQDKSALVYGGFLDGSRNPVQDSNIYAFSFETYQWSVLGDTTSVVPVRGAGAMFVTNNGKNIEIVGGQGAIDVLGDRWIMSVLSDTPSSSTTTSISAPTNVEEDDLVPEARQYHVSVQIGGGFLIAFGLGSVLYNNVYFCANLTQSGAHQCLWLEITTGASLSVPSPRYSLSGCAKGNVVYFFGGFTSVDGSLMSNELWTLTLDFTSSDVVTGVWNMITPSSSVVTPSRARHQCVMSDANMILIAGVVGAPTSLSGSVVAFNLQQQVWVTLTVSPPLLPRAAFGLHYNGTHAFLVGGISTSLRGTEVLRDIVAVWEAVEGNGNLLLSQTIVTPYPVVRADAAVAGVGNNLMVCGGSLYESSQLYLGAPIDLQCAAVAIGDTAATGVQFYPMFRTNSYSRIVEAGGIGGSGAFVGDHFVFFGGSITQDQVERQDTYYDLTESFILSSFLCTQEQIAAAGSAAYKLPCLPCGLGSRNPTAAEVAANISCVFAPPGSYVAFNGQVIIPCPAGRASNIIGAGELDACELCAEGTYAPVPFSTKCLPCPANMRCPLGCSVPLSTAGMNSTVYQSQPAVMDDGETPPLPSSTAGTNSTVYQSQPAVMDDGETPPLIYTGAAVIVALLLIILAIVTYLAQSARKQRLAYFFNDGAREICRGVYDSYKRSHFGLDSERLRLALRDLGASRLPPEFVDRILAENDQSGAGHVTFSAFEEVIITFIERGLIQPFPGTGQDLNPGKALGRVKRSLSQFSFKNLDSYDTEHALGVEGEAIRIHSTLSGGVTRLLFNVLAVGAALALVGQFVYTNISEARATTPSVNYNAPLVTNSLEMKVSAIGGVLSRGDCVVVPSSSSVNINSTSSDRPEACLAGTGIVSLSAGIYSESNFTQTCTYDATISACTLALTCSQCSLDFGQTVSVGVKFDPNVYAQIIEVQVSVDTGINADATSGGWSALSGNWGSSDSSTTNPNGEISQSVIVISPSLTSDVFRGYPASVMTFPILPTSFEEVGNIITQNIITSTGYHVQLGSSVSGNTIDSSQVTQYFGVPVTIEFVTDSNILTVKRLPKATVLDFLSQMLGSITGMGGILVTLMQAYDAKFISQRHEKLRAELEEQALTGEQDNRSRGRFDNEDDDDDNSDGDDDADNIQEDTALYEDSINGLSQPKKKKKRNSKQKQVDGISLRSNGNGSVVSHKSNGPASSALDQELIPVNGSC